MNDNHYQQNLYMKINLTITGCMGRMGQQLIKSTNKNKIFKIVSLTENFKINKKINNILPEFNNVNSFKKTNIIIDFTVPKCTLDVLKIASKLKKRVVIGTTGFTKNQENWLNLLQLSSKNGLTDNITGSHLNTDSLELNPYQVVWLSLID